MFNPGTVESGVETQDVVVLLWRITPPPSPPPPNPLSFSGMKAIKAILAATLAMNENWILTGFDLLHESEHSNAPSSLGRGSGADLLLSSAAPNASFERAVNAR